jgi:hypothetical protein
MKQLRGLMAVSAVGLLLPLFGCSSADTTASYDQGYDFAHVGTFRFPSEESYPSSAGDVPRESMDRIRGVVRNVLVGKGFQEAAEGTEPDFIVALYGMIQEKVDQPDTDVIGYGLWPGWEDSTESGGRGSQNISTSWEQGTLIADVVDARQLQAVWRGTASAVLGNNPLSDKELRNVIEKMFKDFPPKAE